MKIPELVSVFYYKAPGHDRIKPQIIVNGTEYVEIVTGGCTKFDVRAGEKNFGCGSMFWHVAGEHTIHKNDPENPYECICLRFNVGGKSLRRPFGRCCLWENREEVVSFANTSIHSFHDISCDHKILGEFVYMKIRWEAYSYSRRMPEIELPRSVTRILECIEKNFMGDLGINDISDKVKISVPHIHSLLKARLGRSPHSIILEMRLRHAKKLLMTSNDGIKQISSACGFQNIESFCRAFRKQFHMTPGEFRRNNSRQQQLSMG